MPDEGDWPESLDALAAAPGFHTLLHEDDDVRVLEAAPALPPHSLENVGSAEIRTLNIELKRR